MIDSVEPSAGRPAAGEVATRNDLAEDRTLLANERTFSAWARTSLATVGVGLGFKALFGPVSPTWVAKSIATLFVALGILVILMAARRACAVTRRMNGHEVCTLPAINIKLIAGIYVAGATALIAAIWMLTG
ncbi:MAG: DUF202 domain-containing protein [Dokdonella sp.]